MTEQPPEAPDSAATYLHIRNRLRECAAMGEKLPPAEGSRYFAQLVHVCQYLITQNTRLREQVSIAEQITRELEIELTIKDIEIFNFINHSEQKDEN